MPAEESPGSTLELRDVVKSYDGKAVVDDVSVSVAAGEFLTLLGPSGSGKTTTLNIIAGFAGADRGEVLVGGKPIGDLPPHRRDIGVVFQHYALFPHMTVAENVAFPLKQRRRPKGEVAERVKRSLDRVQLADFAGRRPDQLSGGQQQRVALARAMVFDPPVLLMDEPLGALDKKLREALQLEIRRIHQEVGITFVYVTHDQEEALVLSDRVAIFNEGKIEQIGAPGELYERPSTKFVAQFIGESNCFAGRVERSGGGLRLDLGGFALRAADMDLSTDTATIVVRPERVGLRAPGSTTEAETDVISGVVKEVVYLGSSRRLEIESAAGTVVAREQAGTWSEFAEGDRVDACWHVERDAVIVPDR